MVLFIHRLPDQNGMEITIFGLKMMVKSGLDFFEELPVECRTLLSMLGQS